RLQQLICCRRMCRCQTRRSADASPARGEDNRAEHRGTTNNSESDKIARPRVSQRKRHVDLENRPLWHVLAEEPPKGASAGCRRRHFGEVAAVNGRPRLLEE